MKEQVLVSVLIPCFNAEKYVEDAVRSIMTQTYENLEIVLIDDCSTDGTPQILDRLKETDDRIKVYRNEENLKLIKTLNKGLELCSGEYIARMDSDDISFPTRIEKQVNFLNENVDYGIVSAMFFTFKNLDGKKNLYINPSTNEELRAFLLFKSGICHPAVMMRRSLFTELSFRFEDEYLHVEDYALWSKVMYKTKLANLNEPLLYYRVHESQISTIYEERQLKNKSKVFKIHCDNLGLPVDEHALKIYASVAEAVPLEKNVQFLEECVDLMNVIIAKTTSINFCDQEYLKRMLSLHWIRLCANSQLGLGVLKTCFSSTMYNRECYTFRDYIILYIKCLFRLEYKKSFLYKLFFR